MDKKQTILLLGLLLALFVFLITSPLFQGNNQFQKNITKNGFTLVNLDNQEISLSDYRGKIIVLDFMGTDCPSCEDEISELKEIKQEFGDQVTILSIASNSRENLKDFQTTQNANWQFLIDTSGEVFQEYEIGSIPTLVIFNKKGEMTYYHEGYTSFETLEKEIRNSL